MTRIVKLRGCPQEVSLGSLDLIAIVTGVREGLWALPGMKRSSGAVKLP
jgi:hypothetical protein